MILNHDKAKSMKLKSINQSMKLNRNVMLQKHNIMVSRFKRNVGKGFRNIKKY